MNELVLHHDGVYNVWDMDRQAMRYDHGVSIRTIRRSASAGPDLNRKLAHARLTGCSSAHGLRMLDVYTEYSGSKWSFEDWRAKFFTFHGVTVYIDLDDVLADFHPYVSRAIGTDIRGLTKREFWERFTPFQDIYIELPVHPDAHRLLALVNEASTIYNHRVCVLTAIPKPGTMPKSVVHKHSWVDKHFPDVFDHVITCMRPDKRKFCRPGDILIDDREKNCTEWTAEGGMAVQYTGFDSEYERLKHVLYPASI